MDIRYAQSVCQQAVPVRTTTDPFSSEKSSLFGSKSDILRRVNSSMLPEQAVNRRYGCKK